MTNLVMTSDIVDVLGSSFPVSLVCDSIKAVEEELRRECFGADLWDWMAGQLKDRSAVKAWDCNKAYAIGTVVSYQGGYWVADVAIPNGEPPCCGWVKDLNFQTSCANKAWEYMKQIIVKRAQAMALPKTFGQTGPGGIVIQQTDGRGARGATMDEISKVKAAISADADMYLRNFDAWLNDQTTGCEVPYRMKCGANNCGTTQGARRRIWR